jgi:hypothetical protein
MFFPAVLADIVITQEDVSSRKLNVRMVIAHKPDKTYNGRLPDAL